MEKMYDAISTATTVKVRFSGSDGYIDRTLNQAEINNIKVYWRVYNILQRNSDLKSYVIG